MTKVSNKNSNQFHQCHEKSKDIENLLIFNFNKHYIQLYKRNMAWATLHPIWFFRIWNPYDSNHVQQIKKERHLDCKILWPDTRSFNQFESHKLFHTSFAFKNYAIINSCFFIWACHLNFMLFIRHLACYLESSCHGINYRSFKSYFLC